MKFAIISPVLPPSPSGQAIVLYHLLKDTGASDYILISPQNYAKRINNSEQCTFPLRGKYYRVRELFYPVLIAFLKAHRNGISFLLSTYLAYHARQFARILKKEGCRCAVVCTANLFDPVCVFQACKSLHIPYILFAFDDYVNQFTNYEFGQFSSHFGPDIIRGADLVIVPNECLQFHYQQAYGVKSAVLHNPVDLSSYERSLQVSKEFGTEGEIKIVYTGAIYDIHYEAFQNLFDAVEVIHDPKIKIHLYSGDSVESLKKSDNQIITHGYLPISEMPKVQNNADILFLPLSFSSPYPETVVKTSSPGKIGEYLASGKPILVHAPPESFLSWYFKKYRCGLVVDQNDSGRLAEGILLLISDDRLRDSLVKSAKQRVTADFDIDSVRNKFFTLINKARVK